MSSDAQGDGRLPKNLSDEESREQAKYHFEEFMKNLGLPIDSDEHLEDTPRRVIDSRFDELFRGLDEDPREHLRTSFDADTDGFVIVGPIQVSSMCAHHFLPFRGKAWVGYIPNDEEVGLSKLARVTDGYARRPQVQERLTEQIADAVHEELNPLATIVVMNCEHECMSLRGVQEPNATTRSSSLRGAAKEDDSIKREFFNLLAQER